MRVDFPVARGAETPAGGAICRRLTRNGNPLSPRKPDEALHSVVQRTPGLTGAAPAFADNRPRAVAQRELAEKINSSPRVLQQQALFDSLANSPRAMQQKALVDQVASSPRVLQQKAFFDSVQNSPYAIAQRQRTASLLAVTLNAGKRGTCRASRKPPSASRGKRRFPNARALRDRQPQSRGPGLNRKTRDCLTVSSPASRRFPAYPSTTSRFTTTRPGPRNSTPWPTRKATRSTLRLGRKSTCRTRPGMLSSRRRAG